jgi:hypothetical protein
VSVAVVALTPSLRREVLFLIEQVRRFFQKPAAVPA